MSFLFTPSIKVHTGIEDLIGRFCFNQLLNPLIGKGEKIERIPKVGVRSDKSFLLIQGKPNIKTGNKVN